MGEITRQELSKELQRELFFKDDILVKHAKVSIKGKTLINLMGNKGNPIYHQFPTEPYCRGVDYSYSENGCCFNVKRNGNSINNTYLLNWDIGDVMETGKAYILLADVRINKADIDAEIPEITMTTNACNSYYYVGSRSIGFKTIYSAFIATRSVSDVLSSHSLGLLFSSKFQQGDSVDIKNIRLYEIDEEVYHKIKKDSNYRNNEVYKEFPYVDNIQCIRNPYVECKENLLENIVPDLGAVSEGFTPNHDPFIVNLTTYGFGLPIKAGSYAFYIDEREDLEMWIATMDYNGIVELYSPTWWFDSTRPVKLTIQNDANICILISPKTKEKELARQLLNEVFTKGIRYSLVKGDEYKLPEECFKSRILFETSLYEGEELVKVGDHYEKLSLYKEIELFDTNLSMEFHGDDFKMSSRLQLQEDVIGKGSYLIAPDGHIVEYKESPDTLQEKFYIHASIGNELVLTFPNELTGWGKDYRPNQEEVTAFLLGWTLRDQLGELYNGEETQIKRWYRLNIGLERATNQGLFNINSFVTEVPIERNHSTLGMYRLIYRRKNPEIEVVNVKGRLICKEGVDLTIGNGLVLDEPYTIIGTFDQNSSLVNNDEGYLAHRPEKILQVRSVAENKVIPFSDRLYGFNYSPHYAYVSHGNSQAIIPINYTGQDVLVSYTMLNSVYVGQWSIAPETLEESIVEGPSIKSNSDKQHITNPNIIHNGGFSLCNFGTEFKAENKITNICDGWQMIALGPDMDVRANITNRGSLRLSFKDKNPTDGWFRMGTILPKEQVLALRGKSVALSVKSNNILIANNDSTCNVLFCLEVIRGKDETVDISTNDMRVLIRESMNNKLKLISRTRVIPSDTTAIRIALHVQGLKTGSYIDFEYIKLELGNIVTPISHNTISQEKLLCQQGSGVGSNPNLLINPEFRIWQRGETFTNIEGKVMYTADRWQVYRLSSCKINPSVKRTDKGIKVEFEKGDGKVFLAQTIECPQSLWGKPITLSYSGDLVKSNIYFNSTITSVSNGYNLSSAYSNGDNDKYSMTTIVPIGTKSLGVLLFVDSSQTSSFEIEWVKLEVALSPTAFISRHYAEELRLCNFYYEESEPNIALDGFVRSDSIVEVKYTFRVFKRLNPTVSCQYYSGTNVMSINGNNTCPFKQLSDSKYKFNRQDVRFESLSAYTQASTFSSVPVYGTIKVDAEIY